MEVTEKKNTSIMNEKVQACWRTTDGMIWKLIQTTEAHEHQNKLDEESENTKND